MVFKCGMKREFKKRKIADEDNLAVSSANEPCRFPCYKKRNARNGGMQFP